MRYVNSHKGIWQLSLAITILIIVSLQGITEEFTHTLVYLIIMLIGYEGLLNILSDFVDDERAESDEE